MTKSLLKIEFAETAGRDRHAEPVTFGLPFPRDVLKAPQNVGLLDENGRLLPLQTQVTARWPDGSVRWLLMDAQVTATANCTAALQLITDIKYEELGTQPINIVEQDKLWQIDTDPAHFAIDRKKLKPFSQVQAAGQDCLAQCFFALTDEEGKEHYPVVENETWDCSGPIRATLKQFGAIIPGKLNFAARLTFYACHAMAKMELTLHNPQRAIHRGGLWDLGDPGSVFFKDAALHFGLQTDRPCHLTYQQDLGSPVLRSDFPLEIYQDSSGGSNWCSHNHVNRQGKIPLSIQGYQIRQNEKVIADGKRAQPIMALADGKKYIALTMQHFWQNFPKTIEAKESLLTLRLFPRQFQDMYELQGGEQKSYIVFCDFGSSANPSKQLAACLSPLQICYNPEWSQKCGLIKCLPNDAAEPEQAIFRLVQTAVSGERSFFTRREIVDEYGWRNFGDLYADHEAVGQKGDKPLVSHYNNQYDVIGGALKQFIMTGRPEWFQLADDLARHVIDIDIYHTDQDRLEYNHGLFWHTNHYLDASTCTHRSASKSHLQHVRGPYGGGPSLSHVYTTGLLWHYYLTGNAASAEAVHELANFVEARIHAGMLLSRRFKALIKGAKRRVENIFRQAGLVDHDKVYELDGPGRASGNALSVMLDAFVLTNINKYLALAEQVIRQCIHPEDDIDSRNLLDIENRWMYTIFLHELGKYLDLKTELGQQDEMFAYAQSSLLHYADWMIKHEYVYLEKPEKLEYPNETWAAQELRKFTVLLHVARYTNSEKQKAAFQQAARRFLIEGFQRLHTFPTRDLMRPLALLLNFL
jgi:hypothetical protein